MGKKFLTILMDYFIANIILQRNAVFLEQDANKTNLFVC